MLVLLMFSFWSWAIIFDKLLKLKILQINSRKFEQIYRKNFALDSLYAESKNKPDHPLAHVFLSCMKEWRSNNLEEILRGNPDKKSSLKERLSNAMQIASNQSTQKLEQGLNFLAITGSAAPFIGLFGTVWGIMKSFQGIAISKNTSLAVVAPGIAESLLATGIGLFAAIPAFIFYNFFAGKISEISERVSIFSAQLLNILSKELDR